MICFKYYFLPSISVQSKRLESLDGHSEDGEESGDDGNDEHAVDDFVLKNIWLIMYRNISITRVVLLKHWVFFYGVYLKKNQPNVLN